MYNLTPEQRQAAEIAKKQGFYILVSIDKRKNQKMYRLVKDIEEDTKEIKFEMNKSGYLFLKHILKFEVKEEEVSFCNYIPFAETDKSKEPLQLILY